MRAPVRAAAAGAIAVALLGALGLTSCADPGRSGTPADAGPAPVDAQATGSVDSMGPSPTRSKKPTPGRSPVPTRAATPPDTIASRLHTIPASTRQLIVVHSNGFGTSVASLETFDKVDGAWRPKFGVLNARIGSKGFSDSQQEGVPTTPTGVYGIGSTMYGVRANPGVRYTYHRLVTNDYWDENPSSDTYNSFVHGSDPGGFSEALWQTVPQYNYFAVITFNIPVKEATPARGSGIFLHVMGNGATAGCVSLAQSNLVKVLEWLDPAASPRIVMAPDQKLSRY